MTFEEQLALAQQSGRLYRVVHGPDGSVVEYLTAEEEAQAVAAEQAAQATAARSRALAEIVRLENSSQRALRELLLSLVQPGGVPAADVAEARQRLLAAEAQIRIERKKLG